METIYDVETIRVKIKVRKPRLPHIDNISAACNFLRSIYKELDADQEHFSLLSLDLKGGIRGYKTLFTGGSSCAQIDRKILFRNALLMNASGMIVAHNHPSGDPGPSKNDHQLTRQIALWAANLDILFRDHIILGAQKFFSFSAHALLKEDQFSGRTCYHTLDEEILDEIGKMIAVADPVTQRRVKRLLHDRGAGATDWDRLKLSKCEELRLVKEQTLAAFIDLLRATDTVEEIRALASNTNLAPLAAAESRA